MTRLLHDRPDRTLSRLVCGRVLAPATDYLACVVPTFELGRLAGLGLDVTADEEAKLRPAWTLGDAPDVGRAAGLPLVGVRHRAERRLPVAGAAAAGPPAARRRRRAPDRRLGERRRRAAAGARPCCRSAARCARSRRRRPSCPMAPTRPSRPRSRRRRGRPRRCTTRSAPSSPTILNAPDAMPERRAAARPAALRRHAVRAAARSTRRGATAGTSSSTSSRRPGPRRSSAPASCRSSRRRSWPRRGSRPPQLRDVNTVLRHAQFGMAMGAEPAPPAPRPHDARRRAAGAGPGAGPARRSPARPTSPDTGFVAMVAAAQVPAAAFGATMRRVARPQGAIARRLADASPAPAARHLGDGGGRRHRVDRAGDAPPPCCPTCSPAPCTADGHPDRRRRRRPDDRPAWSRSSGWPWG